MVVLIGIFLFQVLPITVSSIDTDRKLLELSKASQEQRKLSNTCKTYVSISRFAMMLDTNGKKQQQRSYHYIQALSNIVSTLFTFALAFTMSHVSGRDLY